MRFRVVGATCDAVGDCGEEITLYGGATYTDVDQAARVGGWRIVGGRTNMDSRYLCPQHHGCEATQ